MIRKKKKYILVTGNVKNESRLGKYFASVEFAHS